MLQEAGCSFKTNSRSFILSCPRCQKKDKLYIRRSDGRFCCWVCKETDGFEGKPEFALFELTSLSVAEIKSRLYEQSEGGPDTSFIVFNPADFLDEDEELYSEWVLANTYFTPDILPITNQHCRAGLDYLNKRGITLETAVKYGIHYSPQKRRVIFPAQYKGLLYGWQGRTIADRLEFWDEEENRLVTIPKSLTSSGFKKEKSLMFRDNLINSQHCVLCEGPVDAIKADLIGGNVCTMGKAVSFDQMNIVKSHRIKKLYLALDPDAASETRRIAEFFKDIPVYDMRPHGNKDLGEMTPEQVKELFMNAELLSANKIIVYIKNHFGN